MCSHMCIHSSVCMCTCACMCAHACVHVCTCVWVIACVHSGIYMYVCLYMYMRSCVHTYVCTCICVHMCVRVAEGQCLLYNVCYCSPPYFLLIQSLTETGAHCFTRLAGIPGSPRDWPVSVSFPRPAHTWPLNSGPSAHVANSTD